MSFEKFQGRHGGHLGYRNGMILAILNLSGHGSHLGYRNGMILAILNLCGHGGHLGYRNATILAILTSFFYVFIYLFYNDSICSQRYCHYKEFAVVKSLY